MRKHVVRTLRQTINKRVMLFRRTQGGLRLEVQESEESQDRAPPSTLGPSARATVGMRIVDSLMSEVLRLALDVLCDKETSQARAGLTGVL